MVLVGMTNILEMLNDVITLEDIKTLMKKYQSCTFDDLDDEAITLDALTSDDLDNVRLYDDMENSMLHMINGISLS